METQTYKRTASSIGVDRALVKDAGLSTGTKDQRSQGPQEDDHVHGRTVVPDRIEIELELGHMILGPRTVREVNLSPASKAGSDRVPEGVERDLPLESRCDLRPFRARADQAHLALENIDELRQLVDSPASEPTPDGNHPAVILLGESRAVRG